MDGMEAKGRKAEQSEATRGALLKVARDLFGERGYADTPTEEIVQRAGVTRGALYHHFRDKKDLFEAVFQDLEQELTQVVGRAARAKSEPGEQMRAGCQAFLDACLEPDVQRIALLDAPSVLGWERWRQIEAKYSLAALRHGLEFAMEAGVLEPQPAGPLAHLLFGALNEAAMVIARAEDVRSARIQVGAMIDRLLGSLKTS